jgi:uncharacterized protein (TIGR03067 family)
MNAKLACLLIAVLPSFVFAKAADDAAKEKLAPLQGGWKLESLESEGKPADLLDTSFWWYIKGDKVLYAGKELATLTVDPGTSPKCFDLSFLDPKRHLEGIYTLEDDTLKICVNTAAEGAKERPGEFSTKDKPGIRILTFKRDKDRKADSLEGLSAFIGIQIKFDDETKEVIVVDAIPGSPAEKAGLKKDDIFLKVGDQEPKDLKSAVAMIRRVKPGSELTLTVKRDGKEKEITVKAGVVPFYLLD